MPNKRIRELTAANVVLGSHQVVIDPGAGAAKRATIDAIVNASNVGPSVNHGNGYAPTLAQAVGNAGRGLYNALNFGADPTGVADSTAAIQAAIDAAEAAGGGTVFLPPGTYRVVNGLTCDANKVTISGAGMHRTLLHLDNATATAIAASGSISDFVVEDITIICFDDSSNTRTAGCGIALTNVGDWRIENVRLLAPWLGILCVTASTGRIYNCAIEGYATVAGTYGLTQGIKLDATCISILIRDTNIYSGVPYGYGIEVEGGMDTLVIDGSGVTNASKCILIHNSADGDVHDPRWIRIHNCYLEPTTTTGLGIEVAKCYDVQVTNLYTCWGLLGMHFAAGCNGIQVRGGIIQLAYQYGILIDTGTNIDIDSVAVTDNSQQTHNTYDGIIVAPGVSHFSVTNCRTGNFVWNGAKKQRYGIAVATGASNYYRIAGNSSNGDVAGGVSDNGTGANKSVTGNL